MGLMQVVEVSNKKFQQDDPSILALKSMAVALKSMDKPAWLVVYVLREIYSFLSKRV